MADYTDRSLIPISMAKEGKYLRTSVMSTNGQAMHKNVNMWAKYKPVSWRATTMLLTADQLEDTVDGKRWKPWKSLVAAGKRPWWWGENSDGRRVYEIPKIEGSPTSAAVSQLWKYNKPDETDWHRRGDFHQYNRDATAPLAVSGVPTEKLVIGQSVGFGVTVDDESEWTFEELGKVTGQALDKLHLGVCLVNGSNSIAISNTSELQNDSESTNFDIVAEYITSSQQYIIRITGDGVEQSMLLNRDKPIHVYMFLCEHGGQTAYDNMGNKFSARLTEDVLTYGRITDIIRGTTIIRVPVKIKKWTGQSSMYLISQFSQDYYFEEDGSVYKFQEYVQAVYANVEIGPGRGGNNANDYVCDIVVRLLMTMSGDGWGQTTSFGTYAQWNGETVYNRTLTTQINGAPTKVITAYPTYNKSTNKLTGTPITFNGIPLPKRIELNDADAENTGDVNTTFDIRVSMTPGDTGQANGVVFVQEYTYE